MPGPTTTLQPLPPVVPLDELLAAQLVALNDGAQITQVPSNADPSVQGVRSDKPSIYSDGCMLKDGTVDMEVQPASRAYKNADEALAAKLS